jgi:hypothetical protein
LRVTSITIVPADRPEALDSQGQVDLEGHSGAPTPRRAPAKRGYLLPGVIALAALLAIGTAFGAGDLYHQPPRGLPGPLVASQISLAIQADYNVSVAPVVSCPASEPVRSGLVFYCSEEAKAAGSPLKITVVETDQRGNLSWKLPASR